MSYPNRVDRLEARRARRPADEYPLAHLDPQSVSELHPAARDLLAAVREHTGKSHREATEGECQAAFRANPDVFQRYAEHLLDVEVAEQSTEPGTNHAQTNVYTRRTEETEDGD